MTVKKGRPRQFKGPTEWALKRKREECGGTIDLKQRRWYPPPGCDASMADSVLGKLRMKGHITDKMYEAGMDLRADYRRGFGNAAPSTSNSRPGNGDRLICPPHVVKMLSDLKRLLGSDYSQLYHVCCHDLLPNWIHNAVGGRENLRHGLVVLIELTQRPLTISRKQINL